MKVKILRSMQEFLFSDYIGCDVPIRIYGITYKAIWSELIHGIFLILVKSSLLLLCLLLNHVFGILPIFRIQYMRIYRAMGNENSSIPSDATTPTSEWQSVQSFGSKRRSSVSSTRIPTPVEAPEPDLSHLSEEEIAQIRAVLDRAKEMQHEEHIRIRQLEEDYTSCAAAVEQRALAVTEKDILDSPPLCPICMKNELKLDETGLRLGQNVCVDCENLTCAKCGAFQGSLTTKLQEWVCEVCQKRRALVLSTGLWYPGVEPTADIPLAREIETRLEEIKSTEGRAPLGRSASLDDVDDKHSRKPIKRQSSLPCPVVSKATPDKLMLPIKESGESKESSKLSLVSPSSEELPTSSTGKSRFRGVFMSMVGSCAITNTLHSDSETSDMQSDVDMEDVSMLYQYGDGISPDEGSDDYSMMSVGSSENSGSLQRKHRPKYLNISRSVSATSSEDENTDSNVSTDNEGRLAPLAIMNEAVVAQAASAFAEEMEDFKTETSEDSWKDMFDKSDSEFPDELKMHKSPNGPVSPSWREGLDSPPFSPPRRDSYPGKRRASSPVSPKDKLHFTYTDMSPPSRQLSLDELYGDGHAHAAHEGGAHGGVNFVQKPSPVSPEEINNSLITTTGEHLFFEKPKEKRLQENLTLKPDIVSHEISEESRVMDLATFAASVASSTANLTQMTVSPTNLTVNTTTDHDQISPESQDSIDSGSSTSPVSPGYYDNAPSSAEEQEDVELADPNAKPIDYQGTKRQKARPPSTDWSPVIDLSPILDVSPSIEEAEQEDMLEKQEEERRRRESQEEEEDDDEENRLVFEPLKDDETHAFIGLKRYHRVENICELLNNNNVNINLNNNNNNNNSNGGSEGSSAESEKSKAEPEESLKLVPVSEVPFSCISDTQTSVSDSVVTQIPESGSLTGGSLTGVPLTGGAVCISKPIFKPEQVKDRSKAEDKNGETKDKTKPVINPRTRRKLPEPTAEMIAGHTVSKPQQPPSVPKKPARTNLQSNSVMPKPVCSTGVIEVPCSLERTTSPKLETFEKKVVSSSPKTTENLKEKEQLQKQDSEERRRKAKDLKAKPNPILIKHIESEEQTMSPQYKVLDSPPSPESRSSLKRDYSDSTSVSPSSSPDREVYPYPSPVTPPDSDSSPPKPHSPSSPGTDFDDESSLDLKHQSKLNVEKNELMNVAADSRVKDKIKRFEQASSGQTHEPKKVRRKLPPIPAGEEATTTPKSRDKNSAPRKINHHLRADIRKKRASYGTPSSTSDESMNEDDFEVAMLTYSDRHMNDLDKPSVVDRRNGNYLQSESKDTKPNKNVKQMLNEEVKANIPPHIPAKPTESSKMADVERNVDQFIRDKDEADLIIDSLINIYGAPITQAMKSLKKRLQEELRRVTDGRRRRIEELEEIRALQMQIGELKLSTEYAKAQLKRNLQKPTKSGPDNKTKKRGPPPVPAPRSSPQVIPRRSRHKRQSSDPMVAKFSPIKEDKDIEADLQIKIKDTLEPPQIKYTTDDSSQSGLSDNDSIRSEPVLNARCKKIKPSAYAKLFFNAPAKETTQPLAIESNLEASSKSKSQSEGQLFQTRKSPAPVLYSDDDEDRRFRDQKKKQLQDEIRKRKKHLEETAKLKSELFNLSRTGQVMAHSFDDIPKKSNYIYPPTRPIPTGIIKPLDDEESRENDDIMDSSQDDIKEEWDNSFQQQQANYSSTEYLAHKQEAARLQRIEELSYSSPYLYISNINDPHAFKPTKQKVDLFGSPNRDSYMSSSVTLPELHTTRGEIDFNPNKENHVTYSDTEASPPSDSTPAMPLLNDIMSRTRKIIHDIGTGSRPVSAEYSFGGVDELMNAIHRVESDNSVDADEPIMKHMTEGGVTILKQLERKKQPPPPRPKRYEFPTKRILLTRDPKDRSVKAGNGIGMKIVGGKTVPGSTEVGAFVTAIYPGGVAEQLHGELEEGDQIIEWNGIELSSKTYEEVQNIVSAPNGEIELVIRPGPRTQPKEIANVDMSDHVYENVQYLKQEKPPLYDKAVKQSYAVDPKQLAAQLQGIQEADSPAGSQSSSQQEFLTPSLSSQCSSPHSDPTSSSSDRQRQGSISDAIDKAFELHKETNLPSVNEQQSLENEPRSPPVSRNKFSNQTKPVEKVKNDEIKIANNINKKNSVIVKKAASPVKPLFKDNKLGEIQLQLSHDDYDNTLNIHVIQACNLVPKDLNGSSDPFVKIYLLPGRCTENKRRTKHISRTLNPEWHQTVMFQDIHREELQYKTLEITVWDYDRFKTNDFLGEVVIDLSVQGFLDNMPHWYPLKEHDPTTGVELPKPTVLPPTVSAESSSQARSGSPNIQLTRTSSPMTQRRKRIVHGEGASRGMGRRRRSLGALTDVDKV